MTKEELEKEAEEFTDSKKSFWRQGRTCIDSVKQAYLAGAEPREKQIAELEKENVELIGKVAFLENDLNNAKAQIEKMKCLNEEIIKALKETLDYEWLPAHNGKAKYVYLQTVIDIVNEKFEEIEE